MKVSSLLFALWMTQIQTPNPKPIFIDDVQIRGNIGVLSSTIKSRIQSKKSDVYDPAIVQRDVRAIWALEAFDDIQVEEEVGTAGGKILVFHVKEKPRIRAVDYKGLSSITQSDILKALGEKKATLGQGMYYDEVRVRRAVLIIKSLLAEKGRQKAEIEVTKDIVPPNSAIVTLTVKEGSKLTISKIDFSGNTVFSDTALKRAMKLVKESNWLTIFTGKDAYHPGKLDYDINNVADFYTEHGFARVNIHEPVVEERPTKIHRTLPFIKPAFPWGIPIPFWTKTVDRAFLTVKVEENDQYRVGEVSISGATVFSADKLRAAIGLQEGDLYNKTLLRESFSRMKDLYGKEGYINFTPTPNHGFDEVKKIVNLAIAIDEDKQFFTHRIAFTGNTTTRDKVIRREIRLNEGEVFNSVLWDLSRLRLNQLGYFEEIQEHDVKVIPHPNEPKVDVALKVKERGSTTINFNGGASGVGGSFLGFNYATNNFLGFGETLSLDLQGGTRQKNAILNFTEPYVFDRPLSLGFSLFYNDYKYDEAIASGLLLEDRRNYSQKRSGFSLYGSYPVKTFHRLGLTYQLDNSQVQSVNSATRDYFGASGSFGLNRARKVVPSYSYSTVDNPYFPSRGQSLSAKFEYTGGILGGNTNFLRPTLEYRFFKPSTGRGNVIALRFMTSHVRGFSGTSVPFYERFYPGGENDIRGFDFSSLGPMAFLTQAADSGPSDTIVQVGGDTQAVLNVEYRIPIFGRTVTAAPFLDVGNAWATRKQLTPFLPGTNSGIRASTGVEVGITMPVLNLPIRVIFAWNPKRIDREFIGPATGSPFSLLDDKTAIKFSFGKTF